MQFRLSTRDDGNEEDMADGTPVAIDLEEIKKKFERVHEVFERYLDQSYYYGDLIERGGVCRSLAARAEESFDDIFDHRLSKEEFTVTYSGTNYVYFKNRVSSRLKETRQEALEAFSSLELDDLKNVIHNYLTARVDDLNRVLNDLIEATKDLSFLKSPELHYPAEKGVVAVVQVSLTALVEANFNPALPRDVYSLLNTLAKDSETLVTFDALLRDSNIATILSSLLTNNAVIEIRSRVGNLMALATSMSSETAADVITDSLGKYTDDLKALLQDIDAQSKVFTTAINVAGTVKSLASYTAS